jgi:hypothetical protein
MSIQDEQGRYRVDTWSAVRILWSDLGENPDQVVISMYPDMPALVDEMFKQGRMPEGAAVQIVTQVMADYVAQSVTTEQKQRMLAELSALMQMNFEEAQGRMTDPLVYTLVNAWQVIQKWTAEGRVDASASQLLMGKVVGTLTAGP